MYPVKMYNYLSIRKHSNFNFSAWTLWVSPLPSSFFCADANRNKHDTNHNVCVRPQWPGEGSYALRVHLDLMGKTGEHVCGLLEVVETVYQTDLLCV